MLTSVLLTCGVLVSFLSVHALSVPPRCAFRCSACICCKSVANCTNRKLQTVPKLPSNITEILFSHNNIARVTKETFANIKGLNITALHMDYCNVSFIANDSFVDFPSLTHLDISGNRKMPIGELLQALRNTSINTLFLNQTGLKEIPRELELLPLKNVYSFGLGGNQVSNVNSTLLSIGVPALRYLYLNGNRLNEISFITALPNISVLNLGNNHIESSGLNFCVNGAESPRHLRYLDLSWNFLSNISVFESEGHCLPRLQTLILNNNYHIFNVPDNVFSRLPRIRTILLKYVSESIIIEPLAFNVSTLHELRLTTSEQLFLKPTLATVNMFKHCPDLRVLHFTNVIFKDLSNNLTDMFSHLMHIQDFKIKYGIIWDVSFLSNMTNLTKLNVFGNYIQGWDSTVFTNLPLREISFARNQISIINQTSFPDDTWTNLKRISFSSNPFECTCKSVWFIEWLQRNREKVTNYPDLYSCQYPERWRNKFLYDYKPPNNECKPPIDAITVIGIGLGCLGGVFLLLGIIVYKGRYHIKHRMYLVQSLQPYDRIPDGEEFVYDAFVAHHINDRLWVINHLLPFLEKQKNLRLCLHERDFLPGNFIADNIINNMNVSRKILLVLSEDFARSEWCQFEASTAFHRMMAGGVPCVVVVMLEDMACTHVSDHIRNILQTVTYIEWGSRRGGRLDFWGNLGDALVSTDR